MTFTEDHPHLFQTRSRYREERLLVRERRLPVAVSAHGAGRAALRGGGRGGGRGRRALRRQAVPLWARRSDYDVGTRLFSSGYGPSQEK